MLRYIAIILLILMGGTLWYGIGSYRPDIMNKLLISMDVLGVSEVARDEQQRRTHIDKLNITFEEKQVLLNRTVFMGASTDMVRLALGDPTKAIRRPLQNKREAMYLVYYLPKSKRPTILVFLDDRLTQAYMGSALDMEASGFAESGK